MKDIADYYSTTTDYLLGLSAQKQTFIKNKENHMPEEKIVDSFNGYETIYKLKAILKEWNAENISQLSEILSFDETDVEYLIRKDLVCPDKIRAELLTKLEKKLNVRLPLSYLYSPTKLKVTPLSRFVMKNTNELDKVTVENLAEKLGLLPISINSWGYGERKPNKRCLDLLCIEFEANDSLIKLLNEEIAE